MNADIINILDKHNWEESIVKLTAYAISLCRLKGIRLPKGLEPEDLVMDAIEKVYLGIRKWNMDEDPDLHRYLMSVIKSILSNEAGSMESKVFSGKELGEANFASPTGSIEEELHAEELDRAISAAMRGDPELCLVYKALKDGFKPGEIADEYAIEVTTVRNAQKRLNRLVHKVMNSLTKVYWNDPE